MASSMMIQQLIVNTFRYSRPCFSPVPSHLSKWTCSFRSSKSIDNSNRNSSYTFYFSFFKYKELISFKSFDYSNDARVDQGTPLKLENNWMDLKLIRNGKMFFLSWNRGGKPSVFQLCHSLPYSLWWPAIFSIAHLYRKSTTSQRGGFFFEV